MIDATSRRLLLLVIVLLAAACQGSAVVTTTTGSPTTTTAEVAPSTTTPTTATSPETTTTTTRAEEPDGPLALLAADPVVVPWEDERYANPGWVVEHDGIWHMFRNSFSAWPGPSWVSHLTSPDGLEWTEADPEPIFESEDVPFADDNAFFMTGYVSDDGTWVAFYYTYEGALSPGYIGRATAPGPEGPWRSDPEPIVSPGAREAWDGRRVVEPSVVRTDGGFALYYTGYDNRSVGSIGLATSVDGVTWEKHDDAATDDDRFGTSDPVLTGIQGWEAGSVGDPQVVRTESGYLMHYRAGTLGVYGTGLAVSQDGVRWAPSPENPLVTTERTPNGQTFYQSDLVVDGDRLLLFLEVGPGSTHTDVYLYSVLDAPATPALGAFVAVDGSEVTIRLRPVGFEMGFAPGDAGLVHLHAYVDRDPPASGDAVPLDDPTIAHAPDANLIVTGLEPGRHTIWLVAADGNDVAVASPAPLTLQVEIPG